MAKSSIRRIIRLETTPEGATVPVELYARPRGGKKKKTERTLRPLRRAQRQLARAQVAMAADYLDRFDRSDRKKRNGWLRDNPRNVWKAVRKGSKQIKLTKIL